MFPERRSPFLRYACSIGLAVVAQLARIPLHPPTLTPYITYVPFVLLSAFFGGLGPGVVTTVMCFLESLYYATEPIGSFKAEDPQHWFGLASLALCGFAASLLFEQLKRARLADAASQEALRAAHQELNAIYANAPVAILVVDEQLRVREANELASRFAGKTKAVMEGVLPGDALGCLNALANPDGCGRGPSCSACAMRRAVLDTLHNGARHEGVEAWAPVNSEGVLKQRCLLVSTAPMDFDGRKVLICAQDITASKRTERELRSRRAEAEADHALLAAAFTAQTEAIFVFDSGAKLIRTNPAALRLAGAAHGTSLPDLLRQLDIHGGVGASLTLLALRGETVINREQTAGDRTLETSSAPMRNTEGEITGAVTVLRDISQRRRTEETLRTTLCDLESALSEKTVLVQEIHHRVKNNLAIIASLLGMQADSTDLPEVRATLRESQRRVRSIALIHERLYGNSHVDRIDIGDYAQQLADEISAAFCGSALRISIEVAADAIELSIDRAVPCALILNELVTNALKHAFPGGRGGEVRISFREAPPGSLEMRIEDDGVGCPNDLHPDSGKSLGLRIVGILTRQLKGVLDRESGPGTRLVLRFPAGPVHRG